jgi:hypothetical protein
MKRFALTFDYPGTCGETVMGDQVVTCDSIEDAARFLASQRHLKAIHIRTCNGEVVEREFTFGPSERVTANG